MNLILVLITFFSVISCKAQYNVLPIRPWKWDDSQTIINPNLPNYYKDTNNELDRFEGTWKFDDNNIVFIIVLEKIEEVSYDDNTFDKTDEIIGEYIFKENGVEIVNSLPQLTNQSLETHQHLISTVSFKPIGRYPACNICQPGDPNLALFLDDPDHNTQWLSSKIAIFHYVENGQEKINAIIYRTGSLPNVSNQEYELSVPYGEYTLIKQ